VVKLHSLGAVCAGSGLHEDGDAADAMSHPTVSSCPSSYRNLIKLLNFRLGHKTVVPTGMCPSEASASRLPAQIEVIWKRLARVEDDGCAVTFLDIPRRGFRACSGKPVNPRRGHQA
jgi:hypothetical protein